MGIESCTPGRQADTLTTMPLVRPSSGIVLYWNKDLFDHS